jgi:hypothetical protein
VDLAGNEVASILVTADADLSPLDSKLGSMERKLGDVSARIDRTYARTGSQAFTGLEQATARILSRVPLVGGVLAQVEQRASSLRQSFFTAGQASETAMIAARKQVEQLSLAIATTTQRLELLRAKQSAIKNEFVSNAQRLVDDVTRRTGAPGITSDLLRNVNNTPTAKGRDALILGSTGMISQEISRDIDNAAAKFGKLESSATKALGATGLEAAATEKELTGLKDVASTAQQSLSSMTAGSVGLFATLESLAGPITLVVGALTALIAVGVAVGYGIYSIANAAAESAAKYQDLSMEVGFSAHELSALDVAASQVGVSFAQIGAGLGIFEKKLEAGAEKSSKLSRVLKDQGVDVRDNQAALEGMFRILSRLPEGETQTGLAMESFGRGGKAMLAVVKQAHGDLPTAIKLLEQMGAVMSDKDAAAAQEFEAKQKLLAAQFDVLKVKVGEEVMPVFEQLFDNLSKWLAQNGDDFKSWGQILGGVAVAAINWAHEVAGAWRETLSIINAVSSMQPKAADDPHTGGQSYAGRAWQWLTGPDTSQWEQGTGHGPSRMVSQAEAEAQGAQAKAEREAHDRAEASWQAYLKRVERDKAALAARVSGLMGEGAGRKGRKGGGDAAANRVAQAALESAQIDLRNAESIYQTASQLAKTYYDLNLTDYRGYSSQMSALEEQRYAAQKAAFSAEETAAGDMRGPKRDAKLKDIQQREQAAEREHGVRMTQITAEAAQHDYDVRSQFAQQNVTLAEETQRAIEADLARQIAAGTTTNVAALAARFAALSKVAEAQGAVLQGALVKALGGEREVALLSGGGLDLRETIAQTINDATNATNESDIDDAFKTILANAENPDEVQKALNNIKQFFLQRKQAFAQNNKDDKEAVAEDLSTLQGYRKSLADLADQTVGDRREAQQALLKVMEGSGKGEQELFQKQYQFDLEGEQLDRDRRLRELQSQRDTIAATEQNEQHKLELLKQIDAAMDEVRQSSNTRQLALMDDLIQKQNDKLEAMADKAVSVVDGALQTLRTNGWKAMFQSIGNDFLNMVIKLEEDLLKSKLMTLLRQITNTPMPGSATGTGEKPEKGGVSDALGPFGMLGGMISKLFNLGGDSQQKQTDASAVSAAGSAATTAITAGWKNSVTQIDKTGKAQAGTLMSVGQSIVSTMLSIAAVLAAGASRGSFWKGLLMAAGVGFISGLTNGLFKPSASGGSLPDGTSDIPGPSPGAAAVGGLLKGPGTGTSDDILGVDRLSKQATAWVSNGEYVIKESSVRKLGVGVLDYINQVGRLPRNAVVGAFAGGGPVMAGTPFAAFSGYVPPVHNSSSSHDNSRHITFHQEIHFNGNGDAQSAQTARKTARQIARASRSALAISN